MMIYFYRTKQNIFRINLRNIYNISLLLFSYLFRQKHVCRTISFCCLSIFLPPANEVWGKVIFLHLFVILFTGGVCLSACWDITPPSSPPGPGPTPPPPPPRSRPPRDQAPPQDQAPDWSRPPPGAEHAGKYGQRAGVRILLECNLVVQMFSSLV